jgi:hypothetical protein
VQALLLQALALGIEALQSGLDLLDACLFDLGPARRFCSRQAVRLPALLPARHRCLGSGECRAGGRFACLCCGQVRLRLFEQAAQLGQVRLVPVREQARLGVFGVDSLEVCALPLPELAGVLQGLLGACDVGTGLVITPLYRGQGVGALHVRRSRTLDRRLRGAQVRDRRLRLRLALAGERMTARDVAVEVTDPERQQFRLELALALHVFLVAARDAGLPLQVADLLIHLLAQVVEPFEVLSRVRDAVLGLAAAVLVARDAGRLFDEGAHVLGASLDQARDHPLLDDGVAA